MNTVRIIPRLDIKGPNLVKGIHLEGLRALGKPADFAKYYYENGADELLYIDVVASLYNRNSLHDIISRTAREIFIPLTVGGGLRSITDIREVLRAGADKVSLNTAAINNPDLIKEASNVFGSSTITVTIEAIKQPNGKYYAYTDNGREFTGIEVVSWTKKAVSLGAGEIILTSIDNEGTGKGFDTDLIKKISKAISVPLVAHGGAGKLQHLKEAVTSGASAISIASMLHYNLILKKNLKTSLREGNTEYLKTKIVPTNIDVLEISTIKGYLIKENIKCRPYE